MTGSSAGLWANAYAGVTEPHAYGDPTTYDLAAGILADVDLVEDWGAGLGGFRAYRPDGYRGIDGTASPFADEVVDLTTYRSKVPGVFMRHVLEHNLAWADILANAVASFAEVMVLVTFTPYGDETRVLEWGAYPYTDIPTIGFAEDELLAAIDADVNVDWVDLSTETQYGTERLFTLTR